MRRAAAGLVLAVTATLVTTMPADAADRWTVSLTGAVTAAVARTGDGGLTFSATRGATAVLAPAPLGVRTKTADLTRDLRFLRRTDRIVDERYTMTTGKQLRRHARAAETTLSFTGAGETRLDVVVRAAADGVAYRYVLPGAGPVTITGEASAFTLPAAAPAWLLPYSPTTRTSASKPPRAARRRATTAFRRCSTPATGATRCSPSPMWTVGIPVPG